MKPFTSTLEYNMCEDYEFPFYRYQKFLRKLLLSISPDYPYNKPKDSVRLERQRECALEHWIVNVAGSSQIVTHSALVINIRLNYQGPYFFSISLLLAMSWWIQELNSKFAQRSRLFHQFELCKLFPNYCDVIHNFLFHGLTLDSQAPQYDFRESMKCNNDFGLCTS